MIAFGERWESVRPIRYRSQVMTGLRLLALKRSVTFDELKDALVKERRARIRSRMQVFTASHLRNYHQSEEERYASMTHQFVRLLKYAGFLAVKDQVISCTQRCQEMATKFANSESDADAYFLGRVVNSKYTTYWKFLQKLKATKEVVVPKSLSKRDKTLRNYLYETGFPLTVVSFYVLRDFYYDFGLLNYFISQEQERITPLYSFDREDTNLYNLHFQSPEGEVHYSRRIEQEEFERVMARVYYSMSKGREVVVDMIELRERVCAELHISELDFGNQFARVVTKPRTIQVHPSVGDLYYRSRTGSLTKVLTLPKSESGYPFTLIRLSKVGS